MAKLQKGYIVHTKSQKIFGWLAFIALFVCGMMVGMGMSQQHALSKQNVGHTTQSRESKKTCAVIEEIQLGWLVDENSPIVQDHQSNLRVYEILVQHGCPENQDKYRTAIAREMEIIDALSGQQNLMSTCEQIEVALLEQLPDGNYSDNRIDRAKIYANLSERGCPENSQKYVNLAQQELEIARALQDDKFSEDDTIEVVETYKRLNMQAAAQEIFDVAKKLTNPAIDFILEVEKIINEQ
ncbi:MAG: hypothetical protein IKB59_00425 [Alphaproteobacteria bacterium]|nr:hypothetical protein [Alphaproteobacteria bacterium]